MALSEHEQRMLDAIERALLEDDPKFASNVNPDRMRRRRPILAITLFVVGLMTLVGGAITATFRGDVTWLPLVGIPFAIVGFLLMVAGVGLLVYGVPGRGGIAPAGSPKKKVASSLSTRMEERFRRRFDEQ